MGARQREIPISEFFTKNRRRRSPADSADLRQAPLRFEVLPGAHEPRGGRSNKVHCVYIAPDEVREYAKQGGFPAQRISEIRTVIAPTTAER